MKAGNDYRWLYNLVFLSTCAIVVPLYIALGSLAYLVLFPDPNSDLGPNLSRVYLLLFVVVLRIIANFRRFTGTYPWYKLLIYGMLFSPPYDLYLDDLRSSKTAKETGASFILVVIGISLVWFILIAGTYGFLRDRV